MFFPNACHSLGWHFSNSVVLLLIFSVYAECLASISSASKLKQIIYWNDLAGVAEEISQPKELLYAV